MKSYNAWTKDLGDVSMPSSVFHEMSQAVAVRGKIMNQNFVTCQRASSHPLSVDRMVDTYTSLT
jgi:hypothetical protein